MVPGTVRFQPVAVEVVADGFVRALSGPGAVGRTFDLTGVETVTFVEILEEILRARPDAGARNIGHSVTQLGDGKSSRKWRTFFRGNASSRLGSQAEGS
jgi:nucleoside-diphosphate-sugar epimerase